MKKMINNIKSKYNVLSLPLKATIWFAICQFLQKGISMLTTPFLTRLLSTEEYGVISTFISWENILIVIVSLSLSKAILNLCVRYDEKDMVLTSILGLSILVMVPWCLIVLFFHDTISQLSGLSINFLVALFICAFFQNIMTCWITRMEYSYAYKPVVFVTILYSAVVSFGGVLVTYFISRTALSKICVQTIALIAIGVFIIISSYKKSPVWNDFKVWKFALGFCIPLIPHYLSDIVLSSADRIMINSMCGSSDTAIYSIAYSVGSLIAIVTGAINSAFAPYQYQKIKSKEYDTLAKNTNYIMAFVAFCLLGIMLFGREIILIFGGQKYIDSIALVIPICLGVYFNYMFQLFARVQEYYEQKHTIVVASVSCAALNIVLNYIFIKIYGYKAAAYTTFVCYFAFCFLHYVFYRIACRKHNHKEIYDKKGLVGISIALVAMAFVIELISDNYIIKYVLLALIMILVVAKRNDIVNFAKKMMNR